MPVSHKYSNSDVSFEIKSNFRITEWRKYLSKDMIDKMLKEINVLMKKKIARRFSKGVGPDGKKWKRLSAITIRARGGSGKILVRTRRLMKSLKTRLMKNQFIMFTDVEYAKVHQKGKRYRTTPKQSFWMWHNLFDKVGHPFKARKIIIPARPFMGFSRGDVRDFRRIILKYVKKSERMGR